MKVAFVTPLRVVAVLIVVVGGVLIGVYAARVPTRTITATFAQTPGLYTGNHVDVLGIPVGRITKIQPEPDGVEVTMKVHDGVKIPADADAVLLAPQVVNDRFVQLQPAYNGGPTMTTGAHIPESRTAEPLTVDQILGSLNTLFATLGPTAQAHQGLLDSLIHELDDQLGGQGQNLHGTIGTASQAISDLASDAPGLTGTLDKLSTLIGSLAADAGNYESFTNELATVSNDLDSDKGSLADALSSLQQALSEVTTFVKANAGNFGASLDNLDQAATKLAGEQKQLGDALEISPLALQNLGLAVHKTSTGHALMGRFDPVADTEAFTYLFCGNVDGRAVQLGAEQTKAPVADAVCAFGAGIADLRLPEGAAPGPVLTVPALIKAEAKR